MSNVLRVALAGAFVLGISSLAPIKADGQSLQPAPIPLSDSYSVSVVNASSKVGEEGTITVKVTAGDGFHCNDEYPHKIKDIDGGDDVKAPASVSGSVSGSVISYSIPVTPTAAGAHDVTGEIRFSVCNDHECQMKKIPLKATATGK